MPQRWHVKGACATPKEKERKKEKILASKVKDQN